MNGLGYFVEALVWGICLLLFVPVLVFFLEIVFSYIFKSKVKLNFLDDGVQSFGWNSAVILIPAHNEQAVIEATLKCLSDRPNKLRILVVADNCTDRTAQLAKARGVEVIERQHDVQRGKGYALQFGIDHIKNTSPAPDVLVVMDADCLTSVRDMIALVNACGRSGAPVQAWCSMRVPEAAGPGLKIAEFAWVVKTLVRPLGAQRLGMPNHITGTGFALPWSVASGVSLASGHLVEDMKLTLDLARCRVAVSLMPEIRLDSYFPAGGDAQVTQSSRWVHGHLGMLITTIPKCLIEGIVKLNPKLVLIALDAAVPPLSLLILVQVCFLPFSFLLHIIGLTVGPFRVALVANLLLLVGLMLAWHGWGQQILTPKDVQKIPSFVAKKLFIFRRFFGSRESGWTRTERDQ